jgi:hypothetical protein
MLACGAALHAATNELTNGGFESGDFSGWTVGGTAANGVAADKTPITGTTTSGNVVNAFEGNFAVFAKLQKGASPNAFTLEQTVTLVPGGEYKPTVSWGVFGDPSIGATPFTLDTLLEINGVTHVGLVSINPVGNALSTTNWSTFVVPPGSGVTTLTWEFGGARTSDGALTGVSIDGITLTQVPEPSFVGVSLLAPWLLRRRRRLS